MSARAGEGVGAVGGVGADADAGGFGGERVRPGRDCGPGRASVCAEITSMFEVTGASFGVGAVAADFWALPKSFDKFKSFKLIVKPSFSVLL